MTRPGAEAERSAVATACARLARALADIVLLGHAALAALWWWLMPHGFSPLHPRAWSNGVVPAVVLTCALGAGLGRRRRPPARAAVVLAALAATWLGGLAALVVLFPASAPRAAPLLLAGLAATSLAALAVRRAASRRARALAVPAGAALGVALALALRAPAPDTRPLLRAMPPPFEGWPVAEPGARSPAPGFSLGPGLVNVDLGRGVRLRLAPLLTFESRSPDRFLTVFAARADRAGRPRAVVGQRALEYELASDDGPAALRARARPGAIDVEGVVTLREPTFGHLVGYAELHVEGLRDPRVVFSPCPASAIDVVESDYPVGRPARLACFDGARLSVLEATSGEKGPFRELARGPLAPGEPLAFTLQDGDAPVVRLTWLDWSAQAGLQPSPTAGWGLPVNAIELQRDGPVTFVYLTLAATSVGRGWDSVGHAPGVYRDRVVIEPLR